MSPKNIVQRILISTITAIVFVCLIMIVVDPLFHYHKPLPILSYSLSNERYQNDGIVKHFDYDAIVTGSSMQENIKTSEVDSLFGTNSVKVCFAGSNHEYLRDILNSAFEANPNIKLVIMGLSDGWKMDRYNTIDTYSAPTYLYDDNVANDIKYLLNGNIIYNHLVVGTILRTLRKIPSTTFDEYGNWSANYDFSRERTMSFYKRYYYNSASIKEPNEPMSIAERGNMKQDVENNIISIIQSHPNTSFYYYINPHSILYFSMIRTEGNLQKTFEAWKILSSELLQCNNVKLFCYYDDYSMICDLDNYKDFLHHSQSINSKIIASMTTSEDLLTKDNYISYFDSIYSFYASYDYDTLFSSKSTSK